MPALTDPITLRAHLGDPQSLASYLSRPGVLRSGHFRLLSGLHTDRFLAFSGIAHDREALADLAQLLVPTVSPWQPTALLAPSTAGVALSGALAAQLGVVLHLASLDEDGRPDGLVGEAEIGGGRILLVNDVVTTGQGLSALARVVRDRGAEVAGAAWFASRSPVDVAALVAAPSAAICSLDLEAVAPEECQLCARGLALQDALDLN